MIYSCFSDVAGLYDYFESPQQVAINADLPVPRLPAPVGKIGVPAIEAGRPMPPDAKHVGRGWHARGIIVNCRGTGLGELSTTAKNYLYWIGIGAVIYAAYKWDERRRKR